MTTPQVPLPDPRPDGVYAQCGRRSAVTKDGRFCKKCLSAVIRQLSPGSVQHGGAYRSNGKKQASDFEPSPWSENAIRSMEGD